MTSNHSGMRTARYIRFYASAVIVAIGLFKLGVSSHSFHFFQRHLVFSRWLTTRTQCSSEPINPHASALLFIRTISVTDRRTE